MKLSLKVERLEILPRVSALLFIFVNRQMSVRTVVCFVMNQHVVLKQLTV